jgi:short subunit dehydrogenase-like uncharacterized protein
VRACIAGGAHYVDVSGEPQVSALDKHGWLWVSV